MGLDVIVFNMKSGVYYVTVPPVSRIEEGHRQVWGNVTLKGRRG